MKQSARALSASNLSKEFPARRGHDPVVAIADLSLDISHGEFVSVVGPSGAGKTTLLKVIAGLLPPSGGAVSMNGGPVTGPIEDVGMVFQNPVLLPWRSALDNVLLPIEMLHRDRRSYRDRAQELLSLVGLSGFEQRRPRELSGGMQQRVALCRAVIHDPAILLMDEPFGSLDEFTRESLNDYLLRMWETSRKTVVFVTHNVSEAVYLSDRIVVLTARPARLAGIVEVGLPRPRPARIRFDPAFTSCMVEVQDKLRSAV